jgi:hypothetical protein
MAQTHPTVVGVTPPAEVNSAPLSRALLFAVQIAGMMAVMATALFAFAWLRTGSWDLAWPYLRGQRLVFLPPDIEAASCRRAKSSTGTSAS